MPRLNKFFIVCLMLGLNCLAVSAVHSQILSWDIDNDGSADALSDGMLTLRYGFGIRGESLTSNTLSLSSTMSISDIENRLSDTLTIADIDGNGSFDALTDGLIILRYLFGITGENLIAETVAINATRNSHAEIIQYIEQHLPIYRLSAKRGIGYGTGGGQQQLSALDLNVIDERMTWFYNWGRSSPESVSGIYPLQNIDFTPMMWGRNSSEFEARQFLESSPNTKYLLGFNEPTHSGQANMTPQEAASLWPMLEGIADDYDLKLVSPAVGNSSIYGAWEYLDAFFEACTNCRVDYIAIHKYGKNPEQFKKFVRESYQYGKPVWITEYAGAGGGAGAGWPDTADDQIEFLANTTRWLESEDNVYRYAWFVGRSSLGTQNWPYNSLLGEDGVTTPLGELYFSIPRKGYLYQAGVKISAVGANNLGGINHTEISDGDNIIATTSDTSANSYLEFDFDIPKSQTYQLEIRVASPSSAALKIQNGQELLETIQTNTGSFSNWHTLVTDPFELSSSKASLRIEMDANITISFIKLVASDDLSELQPSSEITIGESTAFTLRDDSTWTHVIPLVYLSDPSSQGTQTLSINITELPLGGAGYRVIRTNANGFWFSTSRQELVLGNNNITVEGESFERHVRIQLSNPNIRFDSLSINGDQVFP